MNRTEGKLCDRNNRYIAKHGEEMRLNLELMRKSMDFSIDFGNGSNRQAYKQVIRKEHLDSYDSLQYASEPDDVLCTTPLLSSHRNKSQINNKGAIKVQEGDSP